MNLFEQIINQSKLGTPWQFSGGTSFGSINSQDFQSKAPTIQKSVQAEQNLRNQGFSDKEVKFLKLQKEKWVDMNQAFAFVEQKRKEEAQIKNAPTNFDMTWWAVSQVPKALWETASWMSSMGANTPMAMASAAIRAPFSEKTYWQLREEQKNAWQVFADIGQKGKEAIQSTWLYNPNSTGAKIGETITDIGSTFVWPNKIKILKEWTGLVTKYAPKVLNLAQEGAVMGSKYDIATKWEVTKEWAWYGALWNVVFWWTAWIVKKWYDVVKNELPASLTLGGLINPWKLDIVKKSLQVDEWVATPQDVGKWILDRVKPWNKQEIAEQLIQHAEKTKWAVDEALASIPTYFKNPEAKKALLQIRSELEWKAWLEWKLSKIDELLAKPDYTLSELNAVKRELDDMYNLYTKTGDPSAWLKAEWLRNIRANLRGFIEKEAEKYGVNIRKLNNETSVARGLADWMLRKDSADGVRELLTAFAPSGAWAAIWAWQAIVRWEDPLTVLRDALIGGIATKIGTSTAVRTRIASALNRLAPKDLTALENYIRSGGKDAIGKKVAEKVIKEGRALPARTLTKETDFIKPTPKAIVTPQTQERAIINQSKKWVSSNVKRPVTPQKKEAQKLLPAPRIPAWTSIPRTDVSAESMRGLSSNVKRPNGNTNNTSSNPRSIPVWSKEVQEPSTKTKKIEDSDFPDDPPPPPPSEWTPVVKPSVKPPKKVVAPKKENTPIVKKEGNTVDSRKNRQPIEKSEKPIIQTMPYWYDVKRTIWAPNKINPDLAYENASKWIWAEIINSVDIKDINKLFDKTITEWDIVDRIRAVREIKWSIAYANAKHIENKNLSNAENWKNWNKIFNEKLQAPNNTGVSKKQVLRWNNVSYDEFIGKKPSPKTLVKPNTPKNEQQVSKPVSSDTIPEGYFKNAFWEIQKNPSNKKGGFIRIPWKPKPIVKKPIGDMETKKLDRLKNADAIANELKRLWYRVDQSASKTFWSKSEYITVFKWDEQFKIRVSDHELPPSYWWIRGNNFADMEIWPHASNTAKWLIGRIEKKLWKPIDTKKAKLNAESLTKEFWIKIEKDIEEYLSDYIKSSDEKIIKKFKDKWWTEHKAYWGDIFFSKRI